VGAVGVPVKTGEASGALNVKSVDVASVADEGIVVPFTEVTFGSDTVALVISVAEAGIDVPFTVVRLGNEVVAVVTKVDEAGIVVPLTLVTLGNEVTLEAIAPRLVSAPEAVVEPVPPAKTGRVPAVSADEEVE